MLISGLWQLRLWLEGRQKNRADLYNLTILELTDQIHRAETLEELYELRRQLFAIFEKVIADLDCDRLSPESFQSFTVPWQIALGSIRHREIIFFLSRQTPSETAHSARRSPLILKDESDSLRPLIQSVQDQLTSSNQLRQREAANLGGIDAGPETATTGAAIATPHQMSPLTDPPSGAAVQPGNPYNAAHDAAVGVLVDGLLNLGLLAGDREEIIKEEQYKPFYMHRTGHWLGLDVHDAGGYKLDEETWQPLKPGHVLTVEPGLYIAPDIKPVEGQPEVPDRWRGIGIRIEDDVLVTAQGHEVLTPATPKAIDELET